MFVDELYSGTWIVGIPNEFGTILYGARIPIVPVSVGCIFIIFYVQRDIESLAHIILESQCRDRPNHRCSTCT